MKKDPNFMAFFPDSCNRKVPSKSYFWKVYYCLKKEDFKDKIAEQISILKRKNKIKDDKLTLNEETHTIYKDYDVGSNLRLLGKLIS